MNQHKKCKPNAEPQKINEIVYENDKFLIRKLWQWNVNSILEDEETGILKILLNGNAYNWHGKSTFADMDGNRLTSLEFDYISDFSEGLSRVAVEGSSFGFVDKGMNFIIPMQYDEAGDFSEGYAKVRKDNEWMFVDKSGKEVKFDYGKIKSRYEEVRSFREGLCAVSIINEDEMKLGTLWEDNEKSGIWGFVDKSGKEVISPQYIYVQDFKDGIAWAAKGKWEITEENGKRLFRVKEKQWGAIDKDGNEIIPFKFELFDRFNNNTDMYIVHYGGWDNGNYGIIDRNGNWLVEPEYDGFSRDTHD